MGKGHIKKTENGQVPEQMSILALAVTSAGKSIGNEGAAYYQAKKYLEYLCSDKLHASLIYQPIEDEQDFAIAKPYEPSRSALIKLSSGEMLGIVGEFKQKVISGLKLPLNTAGFEIDLEVLSQARKLANYAPLNKYPELSQDMTLKISATIKYADLSRILSEELETISKANGYGHKISLISVFQKPDEKDNKQLTWRITLYHPNRTLNTEEVNKVFDMIEVAAKDKFNAERI